MKITSKRGRKWIVKRRLKAVLKDSEAPSLRGERILTAEILKAFSSKIE